MPDISTVLGIAVAVGVVVGAAWAAVRNSDRNLIQKRLEEEREESANQQRKRESVEVEYAKYRADKEAELAQCKGQVEKQAADLVMWQKTVTGEAYLVALTHQLEEFEQSTGQKFDELRKLIGQLVSGYPGGKP